MRANESLRVRVVDLRSHAGRALAKIALWMIVGYVGASTFTFGLLSLFHGEGPALRALGLMLACGGIVVYAWRNAYRILDRIDTPDAPTPDQARVAADLSTSGLTTLIGAPDA